MIVKSRDEAERRPYVDEKGQVSFVTGYFGIAAAMDPSLPKPEPGILHPQAFIVEQEADSTLDPHFHHADQFQLFVAGSGRMGKMDLHPFKVHFAQAGTPYGPILAGPGGLHYMTLRNGWDQGPRFVTRHREELRAIGRPKRHVGPAAINLDGEAPQTDIFPPAADGLAGRLFGMAPGSRLEGPPPREGGGQTWVVARGVATIEGKALPPLSVLFTAPDESAVQLAAAEEGAALILLQFPRRGIASG